MPWALITIALIFADVSLYFMGDHSSAYVWGALALIVVGMLSDSTGGKT